MTHRNRLAGETSPYLLQHADNPVDWRPWGDEAIGLARREDKPILVSIGYSACHWCHVMAHESFENEEIASLMNDLFVCVKVDREERPDVDEIYMTSVQMMTGQGGWPLNVFLTPDLRPFFGGTYFPPERRYGRSSWPEVLKAVAEAYRLRRDDVEKTAGELAEQIHRHGNRPGGGEEHLLGPAVIDRALSAMNRSFDETHGGFGAAPKFPRTVDLSLILRRFAKTKDVEQLRMVTVSLDNMAAGGMYDQIGGGFHRYSTDERWLVPHFEKMLYDNALLARLYAEAYQVTRHAGYARVASEILDFVEREMTSPDGGFYSAFDADSEGHEGKFYVWTAAEVEAVLGPDDARHFGRMYDVDEGGNFEGKSIPHQVKSPEQMASIAGIDGETFKTRRKEWLRKLYEARSKRVRPGLDDKILADWNGLMISACARGGRILEEPRYVAMGRAAADFVLAKMDGGAELYHSCRDGRAGVIGMLDDYAFFIAGLLDLWEATFEPRWLLEARRLQEIQDGLLWDRASAGYFMAKAAPDVLVRMKSGHDGATPGGNAVSALNILRLGRLTGEPGYEQRATALMKQFMPPAEQAPQSYAQLLIALDYALSPSREIVIVGEPGSEAVESLVRVVWERFLPGAVVAGVAADAAGVAAGPLSAYPLAEGRSMVEGKPAAYVCEGYACKLPATSADELRAALEGR